MSGEEFLREMRQDRVIGKSQLSGTAGRGTAWLAGAAKVFIYCPASFLSHLSYKLIQCYVPICHVLVCHCGVPLGLIGWSASSYSIRGRQT